MPKKLKPLGLKVIAIVLLGLTAVAVFGYISDLAKSADFISEDTIVGSVLAAIGISLFGITGVGLLKAKKWARWFFTAVCGLLSLLALALLLRDLCSPPETNSAYEMGQICGTALCLAILAWPCFYIWRNPSVREYFEAK